MKDYSISNIVDTIVEKLDRLITQNEEVLALYKNIDAQNQRHAKEMLVYARTYYQDFINSKRAAPALEIKLSDEKTNPVS